MQGTFLSVLKRLNPFNSLFGRIFLWFWLAAILLMASTAWLAHLIISDSQIKPANSAQLQSLKSVASRIQRMQRRGQNPRQLESLLQKMGKRSRSALVMINIENKKIIYGLPDENELPQGPLIFSTPEREEFLEGPFAELLVQDAPFSVQLRNFRFIGPQKLTIQNTQYALFMGRHMGPHILRQIREQHPGVLLATTIIVSGLLCFLLAYSIVSPIRQLQTTAKNMAEGDLGARVGSASHRNDEIGQLGREFNKMSAQVEQLLENHKRLLADISHELRTPLARLQVAIGIAHESGGNGNSQLNRIEKEAQQIENMIAQVLKLSRLKLQGQTLDKAPTYLNQLLQSLITDAQYEAQATNKQVNLKQCPQTLLTLDAKVVSSAIENVLRNAVKFCSSTVTVSLIDNQESVSIVIEDDGPGLNEEELEHIFVPFYRVSESRSRDSGGVGLGLAIAQQAVFAHQGNISAQDHNGLTVTITLPLISA